MNSAIELAALGYRYAGTDRDAVSGIDALIPAGEIAPLGFDGGFEKILGLLGLLAILILRIGIDRHHVRIGQRHRQIEAGGSDRDPDQPRAALQRDLGPT